MQNLIESGEDWMKPLLVFRNMLAKTIDRDNVDYDPNEYRMPIRRNSREGLGPYWPRWRAHILKELLSTEKIIKEQRPDIQLITDQELVSIQIIWDRDFIFEYNVSKIYGEVYDTKNEFTHFFSDRNMETRLLEKVFKDKSDYALINNLPTV